MKESVHTQPVTRKQVEILQLIYRYRFLKREQVQALLGHTDKRRISAWLKDLRERHYLEWVYDPDDFIGRTRPAAYCLGLNGIRLLKAMNSYPLPELRKRYRERSRSAAFVDRCVMIADCCLALSTLHGSEEDGRILSYSFVTQADYADPDSAYHFLSQLDSLEPQLCIKKQLGGETFMYLLELFDPSLPRYRVRNRLKKYVEYLDSGDWKRNHSDPLPTVLLVCPRLTDLIYAKRRTRKLIGDLWDAKNIRIRFTTVDKLQREEVTGEIWE